MGTIIRNGHVLDTITMEFTDSQDVLIEGGFIVEVGRNLSAKAEVSIDAKGAYVVPGLIDAHVHFRLVTMNFRSMTNWSEVEFGIVMGRLAAETVQRGFTTVRDLGGEVNGLMSAIKHGSIAGPRIVRAGHMLSQTGGHGDTAGGHLDVPTCACSLRSDSFSIVADGPDAVRKAARHMLRDGSDFLKIHVSGGVASPTDPLDSIQYSPEEIAAAVMEAKHRGTYVAAHAYSAEAITMAVENGVHSIEHANLLDAPTAELMASKGAVMVPTLVTYAAMNEVGRHLGLPAANLSKNTVVFEAGLRSLELAADAGITMGLGTDLIGETQSYQNRELALRAEVQSARDILRSMWVVNAELCRMTGKIGVVAPGAHGDIVISKVNPLENIVKFANHEEAFSHVVQAGNVVVQR
jgi:imidazolonepropionase-like amidohydrolase